MKSPYLVVYEFWDECEQMGGNHPDYASALEEACRWLCDSAMLYAGEGVGIDR